MIRQELIHLHALLFEARRSLEQAGDAPAGAFASYDAQPIRPSHIHRDKAAHQEAITLLLIGFSASFETRTPPAIISPY